MYSELKWESFSTFVSYTTVSAAYNKINFMDVNYNETNNLTAL